LIPNANAVTAARIAEQRVIRNGRDAWELIGKAASFDSWFLIGRACLVGRRIALARSGANRAIGCVYSKAFNTWAKEAGFNGLAASTRSDAITLAENEPAITAWRNGLPRRQQRRLINPQSVVNRWRASTGQAPSVRSRDLVASAEYAWRRFVSCVKMLPPDQATPLWQAAQAQAAAALATLS